MFGGGGEEVVDSVVCQLCGEEFGIINGKHLEAVHGISLLEYQKMFPRVETCPEQGRRGGGNGMGGFTHEPRGPLSEEVRKRLSDRFRGKPLSREHCEAVSRGMQRYHEITPVDWDTRRKLAKAASHPMKEETKQKLSEAHKRNWKNPGYASEMMKAFNRKPNESEKLLTRILDQFLPREWKYTGDGDFWIGGRNPDFVNVNGKKQVIELFGTHWHGPDITDATEEDKISHYSSYGFGCLILWDDELFDIPEVVRKVRDFVKADG